MTDKTDVVCLAAHTGLNLNEVTPRCPECSGVFTVSEDRPRGVYKDCRLLHKKDFLWCEDCEFGVRGYKFARAFKAASRV
jgi:uncharacterized protein with PIN domain